VKGLQPILRYYPDICLERLAKKITSVRLVSLRAEILGRDLPEYEMEILTITRHSVLRDIKCNFLYFSTVLNGSPCSKNLIW
jgi:hypothetical protein